MKKEFSTRLKECMKLRGKRAVDVALECGFSRGMMSNYLSGKRTPRIDRIVEIALYLRVNPQFLLCLSDQMIEPISQPLNTLTGEKSQKELIIEEITASCTFLDIETLRYLSTMINALTKDKR